MSHTRVFIVHGYTASPHSHWFPWLKARLEARDIRVEVLAMPAATRRLGRRHGQPGAGSR
ncbi:alpha/beta hydrolase [Aeromonas hydrophila]|nr:alpha/beta hydrolase [Aeromonas hydrophila]